jgi:hypothetical protein
MQVYSMFCLKTQQPLLNRGLMGAEHACGAMTVQQCEAMTVPAPAAALLRNDPLPTA